MTVTHSLAPDVPLLRGAPARGLYRCAGLTISSALPLEKFALPLTGRAEIDVAIELLPPERAVTMAATRRDVVPVGDPTEPWLEVARVDGGWFLQWPRAADVFIADGGRRIAVHVLESVSTDVAARLVLCQGLSFVLADHGREALHASAVEFGGRAVIFAGSPGAGKSTLATALCRLGGTLLSDDLLVLREEDGRVVVDPSSISTWLFPEVAGAFGNNGSSQSRGDHKVAPHGEAVAAARVPAPVGAVYLVAKDDRAEPSLSEALRPVEGALAVLTATYNRAIAGADRSALQFDAITRMVGAAPVRYLTWAPGPEAAVGVAERIAQQVAPGAMKLPPRAASSPGRPGARGRASEEFTRLLGLLKEAGLSTNRFDRLQEPLLSTGEVAALLRTSDRTVRTWADRGRLGYVKTLGGRRLFPASAVLTALEAMGLAREGGDGSGKV